MHDILNFLETTTDPAEVYKLEKAILETVKWEIAHTNVYNFWEHYKYIYMSLFPQTFDLFAFEHYCLQLLEAWTVDDRLYEFDTSILALAITWIVILANYDASAGLDVVLKLAQVCVENSGQEFSNCCEWVISTAWRSKPEVSNWVENPKFIEWKKILIADNKPSMDIKQKDDNIDNSDTKQSTQISKSEQKTPCTNTYKPKAFYPNFLPLSCRAEEGYRWKNSAFSSNTILGHIRADLLRQR